MNFAVITPFSRFENKFILTEHLAQFNITWHPILTIDYKGWSELWIKPFIHEKPEVFDICYEKLNAFIESGLIRDDTYYSFLCDDDFYEPWFFDKIRAHAPVERVIIVSMKTGDATQLLAARGSMTEGFVGLEQMIIKGELLRDLRFQSNSHSADGKMAGHIADGAKYLEDVFVWFNWLETGRYIK